jgi:hypothetical protein
MKPETRDQDQVCIYMDIYSETYGIKHTHVYSYVSIISLPIYQSSDSIKNLQPFVRNFQTLAADSAQSQRNGYRFYG